tara:strand:+ start:227 stop:640 length:414 start_codon:yes stop_codon:yes gene_type:complete
MKRFLPMLLLSSFVYSETTQYPIELTCEVGGNIFYLNFEENSKQSWWMHHKDNRSVNKSTIDIPAKRGVYGKIRFNIKNKFISVEAFSEDKIIAFIGAKGCTYCNIVNINRLNGNVNIGSLSGKCIKGIKQYNDAVL